jgi:hypothetical protein
MVVAMIALLAALAGTATALQGRNSVKSNDIKRNAVRTGDIAKRAVKRAEIAPRAVRRNDLAPGAVTPFKTNLLKPSVLAGQVSTTSEDPVHLGGPQVTVKVPPGGLVAVFARVEMRRAGGNAGDLARIHLFEPTVFPNAPAIMAEPNAAFRASHTAPGVAAGAEIGTKQEFEGGWLVFSVPPGNRTFSLRYSTQSGTGIFKDRGLWVTVIG